MNLQSLKRLFNLFLKHRPAAVSLVLMIGIIMIALLAPVISKKLAIDHEEVDTDNKKLGRNTIAKKIPPNLDEIVYEWLQEGTNAKDISKLVKEQKLLKGYLIKRIEGEEETEEAKALGVSYRVFEELQNPKNKELIETIKNSDNPLLQKLYKPVEYRQTKHYLGTDESGRDVLMRLIYGARISIGVGLLVAFSSGCIGMLIGCLAGYFGGLLDSILMRVTDALLALPMLPLLIIFAAVDRKKVPIISGWNVWTIVIATD